MLILVDVKDLVGLVKALQGEPEKPLTTPLSTPETVTLPETFTLPEIFCCECGEYFNPDDMVIEYFVDDGSDNFKTWYHKECEPTERALSIYKSAKKIRELKATKIDKQVQTAKTIIEPRKGSKGIKKTVLKMLEDYPEGLKVCDAFKLSGLLGVKLQSIASVFSNLKHGGKVISEGHPAIYRLKGKDDE